MRNFHFSKGEVVREPVYLEAVNEIVLEENADVIVVEQSSKIFSSQPHIQMNTTIRLAENARLTHVRILDLAQQTISSQLKSEQARGSFFQSQVFDLGEVHGKHELKSILSGEGAECFLEGLFILDQNQRSSHQTTIDHATPHTTSAEYYKGILSGSAQGDFEGKIIVRPQAQKTNSKQMNRNILLSKDAQVHTQPLLEIFANDVKCQHGATIGRLDEQALFYLRARGISAPQATQMLTRAFAEEIVARQPNEILRNLLSDLISKRLLELN